MSFILAYMRWTHLNSLTSEVFHSFKSADINEAPRQNDLPLSVISPLPLSIPGSLVFVLGTKSSFTCFLAGCSCWGLLPFCAFSSKALKCHIAICPAEMLLSY